MLPDTMRIQSPKRTTNETQREPLQDQTAPKPFALRTHLRAGAYERENSTQE